MAYKRKFVKGEKIEGILWVENVEYFWHHGKTYHRGWVMGWPFHYLLRQIKQGELYTAIRIGGTK